MAIKARSQMSISDVLTVIGVVAGVAGMVFDLNWGVRTAFVALALLLTVYAGTTADNFHPVIRLTVSIGIIILFSYFPWNSIVQDLHKARPRDVWPFYLNRPIFHFSVAAVATARLLSGSLPAWGFLHRIRSIGRSFLGDPVWVNREAAMKLLRNSPWGRLREPRHSIIEAFSRKYDSDLIKFERFLDLTLESFETNNANHVRDVTGAKEYEESALLRFVNKALDAEVITQFGDIPTGPV
jgi:hypothetical protein